MKNVNDFDKAFDRIARSLGYEDDAWNFKSFQVLVEKSVREGVKKHQKELRNFASLRNLNAHSSDIAEYFAAPHPNVIERINKIADEIDPQRKIYEVCIKEDKIFKAKLSDSITDVMATMVENVYTHVPILTDSGGLFGVFSESTVFNYLAKNFNMSFSDDMKVGLFKEFLKIDSRPNEIYDFAKREDLFEDVKKMFLSPFQIHKRLGAVFITENGIQNERVLGMVTAWDMLS